jgi:hypothetical protein
MDYIIVYNPDLFQTEIICAQRTKNNYNNNNNNVNHDSNAPRQFRPRDGQNNRPFNNRPYKEGQGRPPRQFTNGDNKQTFANSNRTGAQEGDGNKKFRRTEPARVEGVKPPTILRTSRDRATIPSSKRAPESELLPEDYGECLLA